MPSNEPHQVTGDDTDVLSKAQELLASSPDPRASVTHYLVEGRAPKAYHGLPYILHPDDVGLDLASSEEVGKYFDPRKA